jgi:O-antigen ligase
LALPLAAARTWRPDPRLVAAALTLLGALLALALGYRGLGSGLMPILLVGSVGGLAILTQPRATAMLLVVLALTAFKPPLHPMNVAGFSTDVPELLTYGLIGAWLLTTASGALHRDNPLAKPIVLLVVAALVGSAYGLLHQADSYVVKGQLKAYLTYLVALPLAAYFGTIEQQRRLERWLLGVATAASVYVLALVATGRPVASDAIDVPVITLGTITPAQRVRPSLVALLVLVSLLLIARIAVDGWTPLRVTQALLFGLVWAFSFNRASWIAVTVSALLLLRFRPGPRRPLRGIRVLVAVLLLVPPLVVTASSGSLGPSAKALVRRASSVVTPRVAKEDSFTDRAGEDRDAIRALVRSPVFGVGIGTFYGARRRVYSGALNRFVVIDRPYAHNSLLYAYLQLGLLGLAAIVMLGRRVRRTVSRAILWLPIQDGARCAAAGFAVLGYFVLSLLQPNLLHRPSILALCLALALAVPPQPARP